MTLPLDGVSVLEVGTGVAGAYCAKLFADFGAHVSRTEPAGGDPLWHQSLEPGVPASQGLYASYLHAGKRLIADVAEAGAADLLIVGEDAERGEKLPVARVATLDLSWFGHDGPCAEWAGTDMVAQALAGLMHPVGPAEGPPTFLGVHQATMLGGLAAYSAGVAALIGGAGAQRFEVSILESIIILSELQICHSEMLGQSVPRVGVNRYVPTCPLSIHRCKEGWIGITPITPAQWQAFCRMLDLPDLAAESELNTPKGRLPQVDRLERAFNARFPSRTADEWATLGREYKVPMVVVPDARGILTHPIFNHRRSFATLPVEGRRYQVPLTPLRLEETPPRADLGRANGVTASGSDVIPAVASGDAQAPLAGVRVIDFSMGWAGPLATRMLADFGAEVIKIEAGRYPDWWRSVDWAPDAIAAKQFEQSRHFSALNRGKQSVSLDLTGCRGRELAEALVSHADVVVENQAAGVMSRLGLGHEQLCEGRPDLVMMSMSAFGAGNAWSETRAYGSVLEQGSGLPSFVGRPEWPPTMAHLAYGDPVGGIYGGASLLTAIYHQRRTGRGQWINNTQIEAMLPFTVPALLIRQVTGREPLRRGNRHPALVPHGCFACADDAATVPRGARQGEGSWVAIAVSDATWQRFARVLGREDWLADPALASAEGRRAREDELETAIGQWTGALSAEAIADLLQAAGVAAAPVRRLDEITRDAHLRAREFFYDIDRPHVGQQFQAGLPLRLDGIGRYPMRGLAPYLGGDSARVLERYAGVDATAFAKLEADGIVSLEPTVLRARR